MIKAEIILVFIATILIVGCQANKSPQATQQNSSGLVIATEGVKWFQDKDALPFDEAIKKIPFDVQQPQLPFIVTHKAAGIMNAPFDMIKITYANEQEGLQLILAESNATNKSSPKGTLGPNLSDGSQTWIQGDENFSGLYWRRDGHTYSLASNKIENGKFVPLYDESKLIEIANTIK